MTCILVLSDECNIRDALQDVLTELGHTVVAGPLPSQMTQVDHMLSPHLVLLDLPGLDCKEDGAIPALRRHYLSAKLVILFNGSCADVAMLAQQWNVDGYLVKPFGLKALLATLYQWLSFIPQETVR